MEKLLNTLNQNSPFTWEIKRNGNHFSILCEDSETYDSETGTYLNNLTRNKTEIWLETLIKKIHEI